MKAITTIPLAALALIFSSPDAPAQGRSISGNGFDSGGVNIIPKTDPKPAKTVKTITYVAVTKERVWKSSDKSKKPIIGTMLAFEQDQKTGKVMILKDEKVRMKLGNKKPIVFPMSKLSLDDQAFIQKLVDSARIAGKLIEDPAAKKTESPKSSTSAGDSKSSQEAGEKQASGKPTGH